jgi:hypothetical protein
LVTSPASHFTRGAGSRALATALHVAVSASMGT